MARRLHRKIDRRVTGFLSNCQIPEGSEPASSSGSRTAPKSRVLNRSAGDVRLVVDRHGVQPTRPAAQSTLANSLVCGDRVQSPAGSAYCACGFDNVQKGVRVPLTLDQSSSSLCRGNGSVDGLTPLSGEVVMSGYTAMVRPLSRPTFRRVWAGQFVNVLGDAAFVVGLALLLARGNDPAATLSIALAILSAGTIVSILVGGVLADRVQRSRLIIRSDWLRIAGTVAVLLSDSGDSLLLVAAGAALIGLGTGFYQPAYQALFPSLVSDQELAGANALRSLTNRVASILGAAIAGVAVALWGPSVVVAANVATFLVSIATLVAVGDVLPSRPDSAATPSGMVKDALDGLRHVRKRAWMLAVMLQGTAQVAFLTAPLGVLLPLFLRGNDGAYGWVVAAQAFGAICGAAFAARRTYSRPGAVALIGASMELSLVLAVALDAPVAVLCAAGFLGGAGLAIFAVLWTTALQQEVPDQLRGRVFSLDLLAAVGFAPLGALLAGAAVTGLGVAATAWICTAALTLSIVGAIAVPGVVKFRDPLGERPLVDPGMPAAPAS